MQKLIVALLLLGLVINLPLVGSSPTSKSNNWEPMVNLSNNTASSTHPAAAVWESYIHLVWEEEGAIYYNRSQTSGFTWETAEKVSSISFASSPAIAVWQNYVHIVWVESDGIYYLRSASSGDSWDLGPEKITSATYCSKVEIALNQTELYITWEREWNEEIWFASSNNSGTSWSPGKLIASYYAKSPAIACWNDSVYIVWQEKEEYWGDYWDIYCNVSTDKGATWTQTKLTNNTNTSSINPAIAANSSGAWVVWQDNRHGNWELYWANLTAYEQNRLTTSSGDSKNPALALTENNIMVVWSDNTPGNFEIYFGNSSNNGTSWNEEKLTDTKICVSDCPVVAANNLIHVFWHDNLDRDFDIYYIRSIGAVYGVELACLKKEKELWFNESVNYTITVKSLANREDTIDLEIDWYNSSIDLDNWSATLNVSTVVLSPGSSTTINLIVAASKPEITSEARITILARSQNDSAKSATLETVTRLEPVYNISLACSDNKRPAAPGETIVYEIKVENLGNRNDTIYLLDLIQVAKPFGWEAWLDYYSLFLGPNNNSTVNLYVKAPEISPPLGIAEVRVRGVSRGDNTKKAYTSTFTGLSSFALYLYSPSTTSKVNPCEEATYTIYVWNLAEAGNISFELSEIQGWDTNLSTTKLRLGVGAWSMINLSLSSPENALADNYTFNLTATLTGALVNYTTNLTLIVSINQIYNITAKYNDTFYLDPREELNLIINFSNNGNGNDTLKFFAVTYPPLWIVYLSNRTLPLLPGESRNLSIIIITPSTQPPGKNWIEIWYVDANATYSKLNLTVIVLQYYDFEIFCSEPNSTSALNTTAKFRIVLKNLGNGVDSILLNATDYSEWIQDIIIPLAANETKNVTIYVAIPLATTIKTHKIMLFARSEGNLTKIIIFNLTISAPDFKFAKIEFSNLNPRAGEKVRIIATLENLGLVTGYNVTVALYENGALYETKLIPVFAQNETRVVTFFWEARPGAYLLRIAVDPENRIPEGNEENNVIIQEFRIGIFLELWLVWLIIATAITIDLIIVIIAKKRIKKKIL